MRTFAEGMQNHLSIRYVVNNLLSFSDDFYWAATRGWVSDLNDSIVPILLVDLMRMINTISIMPCAPADDFQSH